jgi:glycerol uptake facilitator protein
MSPFLSEIIGTAMLLLLGNGVVANVLLKQTKGYQSGWIVITFGWGMAVFVAVMITQNFSGGHINPAVTLGLAAAGKFPWGQVPSYILAQMIGGAIGAGLVWIVYLKHYQITEDKSLKLATFATIPQIRSKPLNLFSEIIGTFVLLFAVLYLTAPNLIAGSPDRPVGLGSLGALPVGLLVLAIGISLGGTTGYAINPARDLSPRFMHSILPINDKGSSDWAYSWIPVVGPVLGGLFAAGLYLLITPK